MRDMNEPPSLINERRHHGSGPFVAASASSHPRSNLPSSADNDEASVSEFSAVFASVGPILQRYGHGGGGGQRVRSPRFPASTTIAEPTIPEIDENGDDEEEEDRALDAASASATVPVNDSGGGGAVPTVSGDVVPTPRHGHRHHRHKHRHRREGDDEFAADAASADAGASASGSASTSPSFATSVPPLPVPLPVPITEEVPPSRRQHHPRQRQRQQRQSDDDDGPNEGDDSTVLLFASERTSVEEQRRIEADIALRAARDAGIGIAEVSAEALASASAAATAEATTAGGGRGVIAVAPEGPRRIEADFKDEEEKDDVERQLHDDEELARKMQRKEEERASAIATARERRRLREEQRGRGGRGRGAPRPSWRRKRRQRTAAVTEDHSPQVPFSGDAAVVVPATLVEDAGVPSTVQFAQSDDRAGEAAGPGANRQGTNREGQQRRKRQARPRRRKPKCTCWRLICRCLFPSLVLAVAVWLIVFFTTGKNIFEAIGLPDPGEVADKVGDVADKVFSDSWGDWDEDTGYEGGEGDYGPFQKWDSPPSTADNKGLKLEVINALTDEWVSYFSTAMDDWNGLNRPSADTDGTSSGQPLELTAQTNPGGADPNCHNNHVRGKLVVCNGNYGDTGWTGLNEVFFENNRLVSSAARMNEFYLRNAGAAERQYTMCHELGHGFGLPHRDETVGNEDLYTCMDYTNKPENNMHPNEVDFANLLGVYGAIEGGSGRRRWLRDGARRSPFFARGRTKLEQAPIHLGDHHGAYGKLIHQSEHGSAYERDLGGGRKVVTRALF